MRSWRFQWSIAQAFSTVLGLSVLIMGLLTLLFASSHMGDLLEAQRQLLSLSGLASETELNVLTDSAAMTSARVRIVLEGAALIALIALVAGVFSLLMARRWLVEPMRRLCAITAALPDQTPPSSIPDAPQRLREFQTLSQSLERMSERIREREQTLIANRDELAAINEQLRASQKQLTQSEKMASLGALAAGVSHEINNPIGFVQNNLATLQEYHRVLLPLIEDHRALIQTCDHADARQWRKRFEERTQGEDLDFLLEDMESLLSDTADGVHRITEIVSALRRFSHRGENLDAVIDLNACVTIALSLAANELKQKIDVEQRLEELPLIRGHAGQLVQVLVNLLVNAGQAIEGQGRILIETQLQGRIVQAHISDTGCGIEPQHLDQLFTPFFTTKGVGVGSGLGLFISHGIVEGHGGSIEVESAPGQGSRFTINLPVPEQIID